MSAAASTAAPVLAQAAPPQSATETVIVHGSHSCTATNPDGTRSLSFACLNAELMDGDAAHVPNLKALDAAGRGNPEALGIFSYTATQIRMGSNFGKSVKPERPAPTSYTNAILPGAK